jgi:hypothetical protein
MPLTNPSGQPLAMQPGEFALTPGANQVSIGLENVAPPSTLYIQRDDVLGIGCFAGKAHTVTITGRFLRANDGVVIQFSQAFAVAAYTFTRNTIPLGEGYLLSVTAAVSATIAAGECFVSIDLIRGPFLSQPGIVTQTLVADYVAFTRPIGWPGGRQINAWDVPGFPISVAVADPAAGADWVLASPGSSSRAVRFVTARLVASGAAANRQVVFRIGTDVGVMDIGATANVIASQVAVFRLLVGVGPYTDAAGNFQLPLPMGPGYHNTSSSTVSVRTITTNLQAADQWSLVTVGFEEWILGN